jgi:hypothetical protein
MLFAISFYIFLLIGVSDGFAPHLSSRTHIVARFMSDETSSKFDRTTPTTETSGNGLKSDTLGDKIDLLGNMNMPESDADEIVDHLVDTFLEESSASQHDDAIPINTQHLSIVPEDILSKVNVTLSDIELAPHLTFEKYITMQV